MNNTRLLLKKQIKRLSNVMIGIEKIEFPLELIQISLNYQIKDTSVSQIHQLLEQISQIAKKNFREKLGKIHFPQSLQTRRTPSQRGAAPLAMAQTDERPSP